jgi:hypothetical protein
MLPSERLLDVLKQPFSYSYLNDIEKTLADLPPLSPIQASEAARILT